MRSVILAGGKGTRFRPYTTVFPKPLMPNGMTSLTLDRYKGHSYSYDVVELGYNYRID